LESIGFSPDGFKTKQHSIPSTSRLLSSGNHARFYGGNAGKGAVIIAVLAVIIFAGFTFSIGIAGYKLSLSQQQQFTTTSVGATQNVCAPSSLQTVNVLAQHYGADTALTSPAVYRFTMQNGAWTQVATASLTDGVVQVGSSTISMSQGWLEHIVATGAYPIWQQVGGTSGLQLGNSAAQDGQSFSVSCQQQAGGASTGTPYVWSEQATLVQAPSSGTSATTNVKVVCINSNGNTLTVADGASYPTTPTEIDCNLNILQQYRGIMGSVPIYGTTTNQITPFGSGGAGAASSSAQVTVNLIAVIVANQTGIQGGLANTAAASGLTINAITTNNLAAGTKAWVVSGFSGCQPSSTSAAYTCNTLPFSTYESVTQGTHHIAVQVMFVDMQQLNYVLTNLATSAPSAFGSATGSIAGAPAGFSAGLTTTGTANAANPSPLVEQSFDIINYY
jgi:hypothetical protein